MTMNLFFSIILFRSFEYQLSHHCGEVNRTVFLTLVEGFKDCSSIKTWFRSLLSTTIYLEWRKRIHTFYKINKIRSFLKLISQPQASSSCAFKNYCSNGRLFAMKTKVSSDIPLLLVLFRCFCIVWNCTTALVHRNRVASADLGFKTTVGLQALRGLINIGRRTTERLSYRILFADLY